ncbi:Anaphase-promoting complex subunit 1 [Linnemannia gamsii]|uniref:Anaphase-promoting complex subunit 1 n=1 Tax=Linnemannia gamsii TaxID=64522 RepID=A0A9P6RBA5_9FUNG|nr:Anaphase-promoting complex subunit 1 [Linnemannia gamsii]
MEITILGEYKPFGSEPSSAAHRNKPTQGVKASSTPPYPRPPTPFTGSTRARPQYGLYPPTYDDIVQGSLDNQNGTADPSSNQPNLSNNSGASLLSRIGPRGYDTEIVVKGAKVTWAQGGVLRRTFDFSSENEVVQHTLIAWLLVNNSSKTKSVRGRDREMEGDDVYDFGHNQQRPSTGEASSMERECRQQALVVFLKDTVRVYFTGGESHSVHLPFAVHKVWALDLGLMLERKTEPEEDLEENQDGSGLARFYITMDPLNEFQAVTLFRLPNKDASSPVTLSQEDVPRIRHLNGTVGDILNSCVYMSSYETVDKIVVTYDLLHKHHRVWRYGSRMPTSLPFSRIVPEQGMQGSESGHDEELDTDLQMRTDSYFYEITSDIHPASANSKIMSAHAIDGSPVVCVFDQDADKVSCYRIIANQLTIHLWTRPARSAIALEGTRRFYRDILLATPEGALLLWTGYADEFIPCHVNVDIEKLKRQQSHIFGQPLESTTIDHLGSFRIKSSIFKKDKDSAIIELRDAVEDRFNIVLGNGTIVRVRLDFIVRSSLVQQCLDAISFAMPVEVLWDFRHRFLQLQFSKESKYDTVPATDEWGNFSATLLSYCDPSFHPTGLKSPTLSSRSLPSVTKKPDASELDWNFLLDSDIHQRLFDHPAFRGDTSDLPSSTSNPYTELIMRAQRMARLRGPSTRQSFNLDLVKFYTFILVALHIVYVDRGLNVVTSQDRKLEPLLRLLARLVGWKSWEDFYARRDFSTTKRVEIPEVFMEGETLPLDMLQFDPPDIFKWIVDMVTRPKETPVFPTLEALSSIREPEPGLSLIPADVPCELTRKVTTFYTALMDGGTGDQSAVRAIVKERFSTTQLDQLPFGISVPLREALWKCRNNPPPDMDSFALSFIGRNDLAELKSNRMPGYYMKPSSKVTDAPKRQDIATLCKEDTPQERENDLESTGTEIADAEITNMRFGADKRIEETQKMLQSSVMLKVRPKAEPGLNEDDLRISHQEVLRKLTLRTLALPVGRAILTFGTMTHILTQRCPFPDITLAAKILPVYGETEFDISLLGGDQALSWPLFNNGVAAGLRISSTSKDVSPSWIIYNRPDNLSCNHAGFLLALGLTGHLKKLAWSHVWRYLSYKHELTSTGLLLGLSCANIGTMDTSTTKLLFLHAPALLPKDGSEFNLSLLTQVACVLGIGLVYAETSNRRMAEVMLTEIGSTWGHFLELSSNLQEAHSVAAGFGLGLITLGQGNKPMGLRDMKIVDVLFSYMPGSADRPQRPRNQSMADGNTQYPGMDDMSGSRRHTGVDLTGTGATIAMGLMYLKTNSRSIATKLAVPETQYLLDYLNPNALMLRVICRAIVLWDEIFPSEDWIISQVPEFLRDPRTKGPPKTETGPQSHYSIRAGACFALGLRFAGSGNEAAYKCIHQHLDMFLELGRISQDESYEDSITMSTMRTCLDVTTMAASMVIAGSGRIDFLRTLRKLHKRIKGDTNYGSHMAYHMALGFLFLGGGSCTLGTTNRCVAALLCSLYPRLPIDPMDNRGHLQAFRHLWVLAVEPRCLVTREASTGAYCPVPVTVHLKPTLHQPQASTGHGHHAMLLSNESYIPLSQESEYTGLNPNVTQDTAKTPYSASVLSMMTPCLLPELSTISKIEIKGARYWPITLDFNNDKEDYAQMWRILKSGSISVMRRIGHLSYSEDHSGMRGILARPFPKVLTGEGMEGDGVKESGGPRRERREKLERLVEIRRQRTLGKVLHHASTHTTLTGGGPFANIAGRSTEGGGQFSLQDASDIGSLKDELEPDSVLFGQDFSLTLLKDPQVASFAKYLCRLRPMGENEDAEDLAKEELRASYFTSVLYECLTMDKVEVLGVHVWLYDIASRLEDQDEISWRSLWELRILKQYYEMQMGRRLLETQGRRSSGGGDLAHRTAGLNSGSSGTGIRMVEDDGSQTLVKVSRITELYSEVTKRVDQAMKAPVEGSISMEREEGDDSDNTWRTTQGKARHYFAYGTFPAFTESGARGVVGGGKKRELGAKSHLRGNQQQQQQHQEEEVEYGEDGGGEGMKKKATRTDWFKVWLEVNRIPGPNQIQSMKRALESTVDQWRPFLHQGGGRGRGGFEQSSDSGGSGSEMGGLLAQVFSLAYPRVSLKVLEYLVDHQEE